MTTHETPDAGESARGDVALRDWFAGQALAGIGDWVPSQMGAVQLDYAGKDAHQRRAEWCYAQADAMLAERGK